MQSVGNTIRLFPCWPTDQDAAFLRFIESHHLKPGQTIEVEARDEVSDSVRLKDTRMFCFREGA